MVTLRRLVVVLAGVIVGSVTAGHAQMQRPKAEVAPLVETGRIQPGSAAKVALSVRLPQNIHVQSDKPRDPLLIPTALTIEAPKGVTVAGITYPKPVDLKQPGQKEPLAVFEREFTIAVRLNVAKDVAAGQLVVPGRLRYQPCDATMCYPPARAEVQWTLTIEKVR